MGVYSKHYNKRTKFNQVCHILLNYCTVSILTDFLFFLFFYVFKIINKTHFRLDSFFSTFFLQASEQLSSSLTEMKKKTTTKHNNKISKYYTFRPSLYLEVVKL